MTSDRILPDSIRPLEWRGDHLRVLDQRALPQQEIWLECRSVADVEAAIRDLAVRGAPALAMAAVWGVVLAAQAGGSIDQACTRLFAARPTAVNLGWALQRMGTLAGQGADAARLAQEAGAMAGEDLAANRRMAALGAELLGDAPLGVLTHCNTGALATAGIGTALGVVRAGHARGIVRQVYAGETRPWLQGARLTLWELMREGIPVKLVADSAAAHLMKVGAVQWLIVGADRIAANGDTANKIGTYQLAIAARFHDVKVMVVASSSTIDMDMPSGDGIEIELRDESELLSHAGQPVAAQGARAWNPVFDVTPAALIDVIVTERGVVHAPSAARIAALMAPGA